MNRATHPCRDAFELSEVANDTDKQTGELNFCAKSNEKPSRGFDLRTLRSRDHERIHRQIAREVAE